jgi:hypothetical protein
LRIIQALNYIDALTQHAEGLAKRYSDKDLEADDVLAHHFHEAHAEFREVCKAGFGPENDGSVVKVTQDLMRAMWRFSATKQTTADMQTYMFMDQAFQVLRDSGFDRIQPSFVPRPELRTRVTPRSVPKGLWR